MTTLINNLSRRLKLSSGTPPFRFHGGVSLVPNKRALARGIVELPLPPTLVLPLTNYTKQPLTPFVEVGEAVLRGQALAHGLVAPTSGVITAIEERKTIHPASLSITSAVLASDGQDKRLDTPQQIHVEIALQNSALAGLGGAGFPTEEKLRAARQGLKTLIINAAECEPEIACDEALMLSEASSIASGIDALVNITQCEHCVLAIEDSKPGAIETMQAALLAIESSVEIMIIPTRYPTGAESPLIQVVTGQFIPHNEKPTDHGVLCVNVATAQALWRALHNQPLDSRVISLGGSAMPNPCNVKVRLGTPVSFVLSNTNNFIDAKNIRYRAGGPLSGFDLNSLSVPVSVKTNCILAEPQRSQTETQPCIRCGDCVDVCPAKLLPQQLHWYALAEDLQKCEQLKLDACIECGCCDLVCPASIKLTETFRFAKSQQSAARQQHQKAEEAKRRYSEREQRLELRKLAKETAIKERKQSIKSRQTPGAEDINAALARARANRKPKDSS